MRICKVWDAEYPWDVRVEKIARSLSEAGHTVHLVARNRDRRPTEEQLEECRVHRLAPLPPVLGAAANAASMFPAFFNPRWVGLILRTARRARADLILCRDLPLAPTAHWVAQRLGPDDIRVSGSALRARDRARLDASAGDWRRGCVPR